jgi:hypothetical protein
MMIPVRFFSKLHLVQILWRKIGVMFSALTDNNEDFFGADDINSVCIYTLILYLQYTKLAFYII